MRPVEQSGEEMPRLGALKKMGQWSLSTSSNPSLLPPSLPLSSQVAAADTTPATFDCLKGCTLTSELVCGADGLSYMGACLAVCGGTAVAHPGTCGPPPMPGSPFEPAVFAGPPAAHPIAGAFDLAGVGNQEAADGAGAAPTVASPAALSKFEAEGLSLVGLATVGKYNLSSAEATAAAALGARASAADPPPISDRRVLSVDFETGFLYASREAVADGDGTALETAGSVPAGEEAVAAPEDASRPSMTPDFQPSRWVTLTSTPPQPYRRAVWLDRGCSGAVIGAHTVGTAAHCLYSVGRGFYGPYTARPGAYRPASGAAPVSPFGAYRSTRFIVLAGWSGAGSQAAAWAYDAGVVVTQGASMAARVGTMGFAYSPAGPTGVPLMTAGYPQTTQPAGKLVYYRTPCSTTDANGRDTILRADISRCAIAEGGQSGSPLWVGGSTPVIRAVLSRGTDEYDIWYELSQAAHDLWARSKGLTA